MQYLVDFPTRVFNNSQTAIDNLFVKKLSLNVTSVEGIITCHSDHDGQILTFSCPDHIKDINIFTTSEVRKFSSENLTLFSQ